MRFEFCIPLVTYSIFFIQWIRAVQWQWEDTCCWAELMYSNPIRGWESTDTPPSMDGDDSICRFSGNIDHCWYFSTTGSYQTTGHTIQYDTIDLTYNAWARNVNSGLGESCYIEYSNNETDFYNLVTVTGTTQLDDIWVPNWSGWTIPVEDQETLTIKIGATLSSGNSQCFFNGFQLSGVFIPSPHPTKFPSVTPSANPSISPTMTTVNPTATPSQTPSNAPSDTPTLPSIAPSNVPSKAPSKDPSTAPSNDPSKTPSNSPSQSTVAPSNDPSTAPSNDPTKTPSNAPSQSTVTPSNDPSTAPSKFPSQSPSNDPSKAPSNAPSQTTVTPSANPSATPSVNPSTSPTTEPTTEPTTNPTATPTATTATPSVNPTVDIVATEITVDEDTGSVQGYRSLVWMGFGVAMVVLSWM
eukprot:391630_1